MKRVIELLIFVLVIASLVGCAARIALHDLSSQQRIALDEMKIVDRRSLEELYSYAVIGKVDGISCKVGAASSFKPTMEDAREQARRKAAQLSASAITDLECKNVFLDLVRNCTMSVVCSATAVSLKENKMRSEADTLANSQALESYADGMPSIVLFSRKIPVTNDDVEEKRGKVFNLIGTDSNELKVIEVVSDGVVLKHASMPESILVRGAADIVQDLSTGTVPLIFEGVEMKTISGVVSKIFVFKRSE